MIHPLSLFILLSQREIFVVYHIVHLCNLNDTRKFPLDIVQNHSRHYRMDWVDELNDIIMNFVHFPSISSFTLSTIIAMIGRRTNTTATIFFWDTLSIIDASICRTNIIFKTKETILFVFQPRSFVHVPMPQSYRKHGSTIRQNRQLVFRWFHP